MTVYFTADWHFGDKAIEAYESRGFANISLDTVIRLRIGELTAQDELWVLGDIGQMSNLLMLAIEESPAKIYLVKGNHDVESNQYYRKCGFTEVYDKPVIYNDFFILSHEPMYMNTNMPYVNIFGHVHGNPMYKTYSSVGACVCIERHIDRLVSLDSIKDKIKSERDLEYD